MAAWFAPHTTPPKQLGLVCPWGWGLGGWEDIGSFFVSGITVWWRGLQGEIKQNQRVYILYSSCFFSTLKYCKIFLVLLDHRNFKEKPVLLLFYVIINYELIFLTGKYWNQKEKFSSRNGLFWYVQYLCGKFYFFNQKRGRW